MTLYIAVALKWEAAPIISHYKLKKTPHQGPFPLYQNGDIFLVITKSGAIHAAAGLAFLAATARREHPIIINTGICGARSEKIGTPFWSDRVEY